MKMTYLKILYFVSFIFVINGCNLSKQSNIDTINIKDQLFNTMTCKVSEFADSISYIFLETNNNCLLPDNSSILYIDDKDVFIRGGNYLYRFDRKGLFANRIGKVGGGPEEYPQLYNVGVDFNKNYVLMLAPPGNVYIYDYEGIFIKKLKLNNNAQTILYTNNNTFACVVNQYNDVNATFLNVYDYDENLIQQLLLETDSYNFERSRISTPILYDTEDQIKIKFLFNDTIVRFSNGETSFSQVLSTGKYRPNRDQIEDMNKNEDLMRHYLQIVDIIETDGYMFLLSIWKSKTFGIVYYKTDNKFLYSNYIDNLKQGGGIENNLTNYGRFWPMKAIKGKKEIAQLIHPHNAGITHMDIDSNPVIQIVHLK